MASAETPPRQRLLFVTGMLGAGKSTALRELEDLGWESIDNFPIRLLERLLGGDTSGHPLAIGFDCRTRGFVPAEVLAGGARVVAIPRVVKNESETSKSFVPAELLAGGARVVATSSSLGARFSV